MKQPTCIVIFGPQGSGKGVQCSNIVSKYNIPYFEMGNELRNAGKSNPEIARAINNGDLVQDKIVENLVSSFVYANSNHTFIIDGFPRNVRQAEFLGSLLTNLEIPVLIIDLTSYDDNLLIDRMLKRGRPDDNLETIQNRLKTYNTQTLPALERLSSLMKTTIYSIASLQQQEQVFDDIEWVLKSQIL